MSATEILSVSFEPIGVVHSPHQEVSGMPIQPGAARGITGTVEVFPEYAPGLADLDGFSHLILLYVFHQVKEAALTVTPFLDDHPRGVFATRAPKRPNPIGLSVVRLVSIDGNQLEIENVDILDGTPLLDIKPSIPEFDHFEVTRVGWYQPYAGRFRSVRADSRFEE